MVYVIAFNSTAIAAWWMGSLFTSVGFFCIFLIFVLRGRDSYLKNRSLAIALKWESTLHQVTVIPKEEFSFKGQKAHKLTKDEKKNLLETLHEKGRFDPIEPLPDQELPDFLFLWNFLHETVPGNPKENLNSLANALEVNEHTFKLLNSGSLKNQILAINTFGNLREQAAYDQIEKMIFGSDPAISLWAWRALFRIDFQKTLEKHFSLIASRHDWSPTFVAKVLLELDKNLLAKPLIELVKENYQKRIDERQMSRLISYLTIIDSKFYKQFIHQVLLETIEVEVVIAALRLADSHKSLPRIRELLKSERWEIRLQVVQTLGRFGLKKDVKLLISALNDLDWWVRYRAAQSLMQMPSMTIEKIEKLSYTLPNQFARDILQQILAETRLLCQTRLPLNILSK